MWCVACSGFFTVLPPQNLITFFQCLLRYVAIFSGWFAPRIFAVDKTGLVRIQIC